MESQKQERKKVPVSPRCTSLEAKNRWSDKSKAELAVVIGQIFDVQKLYGKNPGQLGSAVELFSWVLADYPVESVIWGIGEYLKVKSDLPTPADIKAIIDPPKPEIIWDKAYYVKLQDIFKREGPYGLNDEEYEYMRGYEERILKVKREAA